MAAMAAGERAAGLVAEATAAEATVAGSAAEATAAVAREGDSAAAATEAAATAVADLEDCARNGVSEMTRMWCVWRAKGGIDALMLDMY